MVELICERVKKGSCELSLGFADPLETIPEYFVAVFIDCRDNIDYLFFLEVGMDFNRSFALFAGTAFVMPSFMSVIGV